MCIFFITIFMQGALKLTICSRKIRLFIGRISNWTSVKQARKEILIVTYNRILTFEMRLTREMDIENGFAME